MSWGAVVGGGISIVGGLLGGKGDKGRSAAAQAKQDEYTERGLALDEDQFRWSKDVYSENKERYDPIFDEMRDRMDDNEPDYGAIAGDINASFASARGMEERNQRRYGIKPTAGAARQSQREYGIKRGTATVGANAMARQGAKEQQYNRRANLFNTGQGVTNAAQAGVGVAARNASAGFRDAGGVEGRRSSEYDQRSVDSAAGIGQAVGSVDWGGLFSSMKKSPAPSSGTRQRGI